MPRYVVAVLTKAPLTMTLRTFLAGGAVLAAAAGCYTGGSAIDGALVVAGGSAKAGTTTSVEGTEAVSADKVTGLPCAVASVIANRCATCHGERLTSGAPNRMLSYEDMTRVTGSDGDRTVAQSTLVRMRDTNDPMPPAGAAAADIAVMAEWVAAGTPPGSCEANVGEAVVSEYDTPLVCTSNTRWKRGDHESPEMHPGVACIDCHAGERKAPVFTAAGTVFPKAHEPDDCNGIDDSKGTTVEITDATGKVIRASVNAVGNFYFEKKAANNAIQMPYTARVVSGTKTRVMKDAVDSGDCNACHTVNGTKTAPGRVMAP